jgi:hypothetical protein
LYRNACAIRTPSPAGEGGGEGPRAARALALSIALALPGVAAAANWELAPRVEAGYTYNDNYRLEIPGGEIEVSGAEVDAGVTLRTLDPRTQVEITPRVHATYFPSESEEDSTDYFLDALFEDATPRRRTGIRGDFSQQDVVRSEAPDTDFEGDLGDPQDVDSGFTSERNRRDLIRVSPYFDYDFTERSFMQLSARYVDAQFDKQFENEQQDFTESGVSAGYGFRISERSQVIARALASRYETQTDTDALGAEAEWAVNYSPTSRFYVSLGAQQTEPEDGDKQTNVIGGIGGRWTTPRNALFLDLTSTVKAVSAGTVIERHQLRLRIDHDISPRLSLNFGLRASRDEDIEEGGTHPDRDYAAADAGFEWRWLRYLSFFAKYRYQWQEYSDEDSDRSSNRILIGVLYEPKRRD